MKKSISQGFITGIKVGWNTSMLPRKVVSFHNNPFVKIFRVIGGITIVTVLSKKHILLFLPFKFIVLFFALLHFIYIFIISMIKLWYGFKILKSDVLNVRNSPLDRLASVTGKLLYCLKYGCQAGSAGLSLIGTSFLMDSMLEVGNQEKVFTPWKGNRIKLFVENEPVDLLDKFEKGLDGSKDFSEQEKYYISTNYEIKYMEIDNIVCITTDLTEEY